MLAIVLATVALVVADARAHEPSRINAREIVRLSGTFGAPSKGGPKTHDVAVSVLGKKRTLHAGDWQVFALVIDQQTKEPEAPESVELQGPRETLARIASAGDEQRVSILAERRAGSDDLFVLALDLCPGD